FSIAGHKLYGPKGVGVLYIRRGVQVEPLMHGAGHESGRRAGTENVVFDLTLCAACALAAVDLDLRAPRLARLRDQLQAGLNESFGDHMHLNGHPTERLPNTPNVGFV